MSDGDTSSISSNSTIEELPFETVKSNLKLAAADSLETGDFLSYSTVIDIYLSDPTKYEYAEREELLQTLLDVLNENPKLTYEIGWDLPQLVVLYVELNFAFDLPLRSSPCTVKVFKIFECLAKHGNPKELFLKACELLSELNVNDNSNTDDTEEIREKFFDLKLYCILELINSNLKKIETLYPSKFLAMFMTAFLNCLHQFFKTNVVEDTEFIFKRIYSIIRNYDTMPLPKEIELSDKELRKIVADENALQRKILISFITNAATVIGRTWSSNRSVLYFKNFCNKPIVHDQNLLIIDRFHELCFSFDIDLNTMFKDFIVDSHTLFHKFDLKKSTDDLIGDIFETLVVDYQENLLTSIVNKDARELQISKLGCLIYHYSYPLERSEFPLSITFNDALVLTLRLIVPMMVNPAFMSSSLKDIVVYWSWYTIEKLIHEGKNISLEISSIPKVFLITYFQCILFIISSDNSSKYFRYTSLTLLTRILILTPEQISYEFLKDCLSNFPSISMKSAIVGILKELLTKDKIDEKPVKEEPLEEELAKLSVKAPKLPERDTVKATKFLTLTDAIFKDIIDFINNVIDESFVEVENPQDSGTETETEVDEIRKYRVNPQQLSLLSVTLNLIVAIKKYDVAIKHQNEVDKIVKYLSDVIASCKKQKDHEAIINLLDMLAITLDRIKN